MPAAAVSSENVDPNSNADHIFWVPEKSIAELKKIASSKQESKPDDIYALTCPEGHKDTEMVVPVDLRGVSADFAKDFDDDFDVMVEKLGPKATAAGLLKGHDYWKQNKGKEHDNIREEPITVKEWKERLADDGFDEDEEEEDENDEDEDENSNKEGEEDQDGGEEGGEEEEGEGDEEEDAEEDVPEPAPKKKKTA